MGRAFLGMGALAASEERPARPNIVLILADDLGYSDIGCFGSEIPTPNLDGLAANGLRFTQFYNAARCCPTRASLLTGLYPHRAGVGGMNSDQGQPGYRGFPQPNARTIAEVLKSAGYSTAMAGKWHLSLGGPKPSPRPTDRGFDEFYGMIGGFNSCFQEHPFYTRLPAGRIPRAYPEDGFYSTDVFADYAIDFLEEARRRDQPIFLYLAFNAPHFPLHAPPEDAARHEKTYLAGWDQLRAKRYDRMKEFGIIDAKWPLPPRSPYETRRDFYREGENPAWDSLDAGRRADLARRMAIYAAMVERMDQAIGRVAGNLRANGELDRTLIFFLSDNGACAEWDPFGFDGSSGPNNILHLGDALKAMGGPDTYHSYGSAWANLGNTPFRWYKHFTYEGGISTPLIVHWPAGIPGKGAIIREPGHVIDIMATCVDVSGASYPDRVGFEEITPLQGRSLKGAFQAKPIGRELLAWEHEGNRAARVGDWKIVSRHGHPWELYNLKSDRTEMTDLAAAMPEKVAELSERWDGWADENHVKKPDEPRAGQTR